jgi:hypothetical protein
MDAILILLLGGICIIGAVYILVKTETISGMVYCLLLGAAFAIMGFLDLRGLLDSEWTFVGLNAMGGIILILGCIASLYSPPSLKAPRWTEWAMLVFGAFLVFLATERSWRLYWR